MKNNSGSDNMEIKKLWNKSFIIACLANFAMFFAFYMLMPVLPMYLADEFAADSSEVGLVLSSYIIMALLIRPFAGYFVDTLPRKKLLLVCLFCYMLCFGGYIIAASLMVFMIFRALHGGAFGIGTVSMNTMAIDIMPAERRGEGIGYFGVMSNLAMASGPMISLMIYESSGNFKILFIISMSMALLALLLSTMIIAPYKEKKTGVEPISLDRFILVKGLPIAAVMALIAFSYGALSTYIAQYGKEVMGVESGSGNFFLFFSAGLISSRLTSGKLINKGLFKPVAITGVGLLIISYFFFVTIFSPTVYYVAGVFMGVGYGVLSPVFQTMFINLAPHNKRGTANATYFASWDAGIGVGVLMGGVITDYYSLLTAFRFGILLLAAGLLLYIFRVAPFYVKNKLR